jgi:hypothetical protein
MWERDGSYPNPRWLDSNGKTKYPLPSDSEPLYSSFTKNGEFPLYTCGQCGRRLPPGNFARSELAKARLTEGGGRCGACLPPTGFYPAPGGGTRQMNDTPMSRDGELDGEAWSLPASRDGKLKRVSSRQGLEQPIYRQETAERAAGQAATAHRAALKKKKSKPMFAPAPERRGGGGRGGGGTAAAPANQRPLSASNAGAAAAAAGRGGSRRVERRPNNNARPRSAAANSGRRPGPMEPYTGSVVVDNAELMAKLLLGGDDDDDDHDQQHQQRRTGRGAARKIASK